MRNEVSVGKSWTNGIFMAKRSDIAVLSGKKIVDGLGKN
jgi:hypothetical protein